MHGESHRCHHTWILHKKSAWGVVIGVKTSNSSCCPSSDAEDDRVAMALPVSSHAQLLWFDQRSRISSIQLIRNIFQSHHIDIYLKNDHPATRVSSKNSPKEAQKSPPWMVIVSTTSCCYQVSYRLLTNDHCYPGSLYVDES